jgi:two-component system, NarL family, response regulator DegU
MEKSRLKVLLADRHALVLEGLRRMLEADTGIEIVGAVRTGDDAVKQACRLSPDVVVMDPEITGTDGIRATRQLREKMPMSKVLMMSFGEDFVNESIEAGASGYMIKDSETSEITTAVHQVSQGLCPIAPSITRKLVTQYAELKRNHDATILSKREIEVLKLIADGKNSTEIGASLFVSLSTVKREVSQIFDKLGVNDRPHAVSEAMKRKLI